VAATAWSCAEPKHADPPATTQPAIAPTVQVQQQPDSITRPPAPRVPKPSVVRGLYVNRWMAIGQRMWELIEIARTTQINALVIDVKDDRGFVLYHSLVPLAKEIGADTTRPMSYRRLRAVLDTMRAAGIYPIARIVVAKDPLLADARLAWSIKTRADTSR